MSPRRRGNSVGLRPVTLGVGAPQHSHARPIQDSGQGDLQRILQMGMLALGDSEISRPGVH